MKDSLEYVSVECFMDSATPSVSPTSELPYDLNLMPIEQQDNASRVTISAILLVYTLVNAYSLVATLVSKIAHKHHILVFLQPEALVDMPEFENRASEYCCTVIRNLASVDMVFRDTPSKSLVVLDTNGTTSVTDYYPPLEASLISCCRYSSLGPPNSTDWNLSGQSYNYLDRPQYRLRAMSQLF